MYIFQIKNIKCEYVKYEYIKYEYVKYIYILAMLNLYSSLTSIVALSFTLSFAKQ